MKIINYLQNILSVGLILRLLISFFLLFTIKSNADEPFWELISITPPRGTVFHFISSKNGNLYTGGYHGGLFLSTDNGENWQRISDNSKSGIITIENIIITCGIENINNIYVFTIYKSSDNGKNWLDISGSLDKNLIPNRIVSDSDKIYITLLDSNFKYRIIYCSTNEGTSWENIGSLKLKTKAIAFKDFFARRNILVSITPHVNQESTYLDISTDLGKTWKEVYFQKYIINLIIAKDNKFYASTRNGIWCSSDFGETWEQKWLADYPIESFLISDSLKSIYASILRSNSIPNQTLGLLFSSDIGITWDLVGGFEKFLLNSISNIIQNDAHIFVTPQYLGTYRSEFNNLFWQEKNQGYSAMLPSDFIFQDDKIYMSCFGFFKSENEGKTFDYIGFKAYDTGPIAVNSNRDYFVGDKGTGKGIFRSTDGGVSWDTVNPGARSVDAIVINSKDYIFVEPGYRSTDNGETWQDLGLECSFLAINDEDHVFSFDYGIISRSTDNGVTWEKQLSVNYDPTFNERGGRIIFNNKTKTAAYSILPRNPDSCCFITTDNGRTWKLTKTLGMTDSKTTAVDSMYCWVKTGAGGIYRSCDNGLTWYKLDTTGLKHKDYETIGVSPDGHIYVFGSTGGLYRSRDAFISIKEVGVEQAQPLLEIIPNPVSDETTITYNLTKPGNVTITLTDILGREVAVLQKNEYKEAGFNNYQFSIFNYQLTNGIYYIKLVAGNITLTEKMVVIR